VSATSKFPDNLSRAEADDSKILVWDLPTRLFHWLMVLSFAGAWLTAETERWRLLHATLGYTMVGLVAFRIVWGLIGSRHARFSAFVRGPRAVLRYLGSLLRGQPEHHLGHNPAGAAAILLLIALTLAVGATGWAVYNDVGGKWLEELHEGVSGFMLALVGLHVAAVVFTGWLHRENLVRAMITGRKPGPSAQGLRRAFGGVAALLLAAVLGFWWVQWHDAPSAGGFEAGMAAAVKPHRTAE
jgi:cytochrome b